MISARLRHYDAVPYLTMLLFCKSSAAVWPAGERERETRAKEGAEDTLREIFRQKQI